MLELTPDNTANYLHSQGWLDAGPVQVEALSWGVSNAVLRVTTPERLLVVKQSRPRLRTREDWFSNIERIFREVHVMQWLHSFLPSGTVPEILFVDRDNYLFGMAHAPANTTVWKESLLKGEIDRAVAYQAGAILGTIHEHTATHAPPSFDQTDDLSERTVFVQLRIDPFYQRIRERRPEVAHAVAGLIDQMLTRTEALCHGDFSPKNFLVHANTPQPERNPKRSFTLVDYETGHLGDPTMDLGFFLSHLILKSIKNRAQRQSYYQLTEAFWETYGAVVRFQPIADLTARGIQHFAVCALARIDGTSPVDYLPEPEQQEQVRRLSRRVLFEQPREWSQVLALCEEEATRE